MILVDTSVWINHFRDHDAVLANALEAGEILSQPFVIGELALGNLRQRRVILDALADLPGAIVASDTEVLTLIDGQRLFGMGIGYVDAHLLASTRLTPGAAVWTRDRRLRAAADRLGVTATGD